MKVKATYRLVFEVTRETEIDDESYAALVEHERIRDRDTSDERLMPMWLESHLYEEDAEVFRDWRTSKPLPADFEFQYADVTEAVAAEVRSTDTTNRGNESRDA